MLVGLTEEQVQLGESVRGLLARVCGERDVRRLMATATGVDDGVWRALADLGLVGLMVGADDGGAGGTLVDAGVVLEELGRRLATAPYLATAVLGVSVLAQVDDAGPLLKEIAAGGTTVTVAVTENSALWRPSDIATRAVERDGRWWLSGVKNWVLGGASVDTILVAARAEDGLRLFSVAGDAEGLTRTPLPTMDQTRKQATLEFAETSAVPLPTTSPVSDVLRAVELTGVAAVAAEQVGGALEVLDMVLAHVQNRHQFGKPIGSFQAIQHKCADIAVDIEAGRSAAYYACRALAAGADDAVEAAELAKAYGSEMFRRVTDAAVQIFGGMAMTWEHPIHLYFKRARSSEILFGTPAQHREILAGIIGL